jgi:excisionase family DNA binding protein
MYNENEKIGGYAVPAYPGDVCIFRRSPMDDKPLGIKDAMELTGYSRSYLYQLIHFKKIPYHKPNNGRVFFKKSELLDFIYRGKKAADYEVSEQADAILNGETK